MENKKTMFLVVNYTPGDQCLGITKKIRSVIDAFRRKDYLVYYSAYGKAGIDIYDYNDKVVHSEKYSSENHKLSSIIRRFDLIQTCTKYFKSSKMKFDIVFMRYLGFDQPYIGLLKKCKKSCAYIIVDMLGYFQGIKSKDLKGLYMNINTDLFHKQAIKYIDEMLTEGDENILFGKKTVKSEMGIDCEKYRMHSYNGNEKQINLISVANETLYHGYDRLINSLAAYYEKANVEVEINLHLVGVISESTKNIIISKKMTEHVTLYGKQYGDVLMDIYDKCNMAVGPLGQHRIGGKKDTGLKTREYFGMGIPYFYSGVESVVLNHFPYIFEVPSDESMINFYDIIDFYNSYKNLYNVAGEMRQFAQEHYSWDRITDSFLENYNQNKV